MPTSTRSVAVAGTLIALVLAGCADDEGAGDAVTDEVEVSDPTISPTTAPQGTEPMVVMVDIAYQPDRISVEPGTTISFVHEDPEIPHTVTARDGSFESGQIEAGETFTVTVQGPGEIPFYCQIHPDQMQGAIEIVESG